MFNGAALCFTIPEGCNGFAHELKASTWGIVYRPKFLSEKFESSNPPLISTTLLIRSSMRTPCPL